MWKEKNCLRVKLTYSRINVGFKKGRRTKCLSFVSPISTSEPLACWEAQACPITRKYRKGELERKREKVRKEKRKRGEGGRLQSGRERRWGRDWNGIRGMSCNNRPPFDRPFRRETAPPLSSARLVSAQLSHDDDGETNGEMLTYPSFYLVRNHSCLPSSKRRTYVRLFYLKMKDTYRIPEKNLQMFPRRQFSLDNFLMWHNFCECDFLRI